MILETVDIIRTAMEKGLVVNVIINNRAGGHAPVIANLIADRFKERNRLVPKGRLDLW